MSEPQMQDVEHCDVESRGEESFGREIVVITRTISRDSFNIASSIVT